MSVTLRSIIIAVCLMIAAAFLYQFSSLQGQMSTEEIQARFPTFEATDFAGQVFDNEGLIKYNIASEQVVYYQDRGLVEMKNPIGQYFDHSDPMQEGDELNESEELGTAFMQINNEQEVASNQAQEMVQESVQEGKQQSVFNAGKKPFHYWQIEANQGYMINHKEAVLTGNVKISPSSKEVKIQQIVTPNMFYDLVANTISSKDEIMIQGEQFIDQGRDYTLDLNAKTFVIRDKPHAVYYP